MNFTEIVVLVCLLTGAYGVVLMAMSYAKVANQRMKTMKRSRMNGRYREYSQRVKLTRDTMRMISDLIQQVILLEFQELDDTRGVERTNLSHYQRLMEKISNEVMECLKPRMGMMTRYTMLDEEYIGYFIIRHTEICLKRALSIVLDTDEAPIDINEDQGGNNG